MSRIGKQPIAIPAGTTVTVTDHVVSVKGPKGELSRTFKPDITIAVQGSAVVLEPKKTTTESAVLWGTYASHVKNMIEGVNEPYVKKLIIEGVGYRAELKGNTLSMRLGFSHPVELSIPDGISVAVEKEAITITGIDKEKVGHFAAKIRMQKKPEPYKGKGIHYEGEVIRRKQGKRAMGAA